MHFHCIGGPTQFHLSGFLLQLCASFDSGGNLFLYRNSHINNFVCLLILRNLDVLGLVVDLLLDDLLQGDLLDDPGRLHFDSVDDVFVHGVRQLSVDPRKFPSVGLHLVAVSFGTCLPKARLSQDLVCRVSFVGRYVVDLSGATHGLPAHGPPRVPWVSCLDPQGCRRVQDGPVTKSQPLCVLVGVVTSCVLCARVPRVLRDVLTTGCISCATENTYIFHFFICSFFLSFFIIFSFFEFFHFFIFHFFIYPFFIFPCFFFSCFPCFSSFFPFFFMFFLPLSPWALPKTSLFLTKILILRHDSG